MTNASPSARPRVWTIGLDPWIVQDGNYGEFAVDDVRDFALEFWADAVSVTGSRERSPVHLGGRRYRVQAPVLFVEGKMWMIDAGVLAYCDAGTPEGIAEGTWLSGEIVLGIDPFLYVDRYAAHPRVPDAVHTWRIAAIRERTAPTPPPGVYLTPEEMDWTVREVRETDAWNEPGDKVVEYDLVCELLDVRAKRRLDVF